MSRARKELSSSPNPVVDRPAWLICFLKTLEEPAPHTTLLLLTTRPYALLPTIPSRVLHFRFPSVATNVDYTVWPALLDSTQ